MQAFLKGLKHMDKRYPAVSTPQIVSVFTWYNNIVSFQSDQKYPDIFPNPASAHSGALLITPKGFFKAVHKGWCSEQRAYKHIASVEYNRL